MSFAAARDLWMAVEGELKLGRPGFGYPDDEEQLFGERVVDRLLKVFIYEHGGISSVPECDVPSVVTAPAGSMGVLFGLALVAG